MNYLDTRIRRVANLRDSPLSDEFSSIHPRIGWVPKDERAFHAETPDEDDDRAIHEYDPVGDRGENDYNPV